MSMVINQGSIEVMVVEVKDALVGITVLPDPTRFDIYDTDGTIQQANQVATVSGLKALCRIDTSALAIKDYELFVKFTVGVETPILGPHRFRVQ